MDENFNKDEFIKKYNKKIIENLFNSKAGEEIKNRWKEEYKDKINEILSEKITPSEKIKKINELFK